MGAPGLPDEALPPYALQRLFLVDMRGAKGLMVAGRALAPAQAAAKAARRARRSGRSQRAT
jgi:hypothetical protein